MSIFDKLKNKFSIKIFLQIVTGINLVISIIFLLTLYFGIEESLKHESQCDNEGFKNLIIYFNSAIQVGTVLLITLTICFTIYRMNQTKAQIDQMIDNNRFNNYYKHREEFVKFFQDNKLFQKLAEAYGYTLNQLLLEYYKIYYYKRDEEFQKRIKPSTLQAIEDFFAIVRISGIDSENDLDLSELDLSDVSKPNGNYMYHYLEIKKLIDGFNVLIKTNLNMSDYQILIFSELLDIYYNYLIILDILSFDGQPLSKYGLSLFSYNLRNLCKKFNLKEVLIIKIDD